MCRWDQSTNCRSELSPSCSPTSRARHSCSSGSVIATGKRSRITSGSCARHSSRTAATRSTRRGIRSSLPSAVPRMRCPRAIAGQRGLAEHAWPDDAELRVRMGIHTGEPAVGGERYVGFGVHRAARICAAGHGGQVLVSQTTRELLRDDPIPAVSLLDLGEHHLKDMDEPERLYQLVAPGLQEEFRELKTAAHGPFEGREGELAEAAAEEIARSWRRPGRRVLIAATLAAAVVGAALGVLLTYGGGSAADASVGANELGVIDGASGKIVSSIPVGGPPGQVAAGADAIWATNAARQQRSYASIPRRTTSCRRSRSEADPPASRSAKARSGSPTVSTAPSRGSTRRSTRS